jgi:hypothetical protein
MRHFGALALAATISFALAEVQQLPLVQQLDNEFGNYHGDQVWRLEWAGLDRHLKDDIQEAIEVCRDILKGRKY